MKRYGNLYHKIYDLENIRLAHKNAKKGKAHYSEVKMVEANGNTYAIGMDKARVKKERYLSFPIFLIGLFIIVL